MYRITKLYRPEIYQGKYKKQHYFEGWYFKIIDSTMEHALAIIPGVSISENDSHAFIQVLDAENKVYYFRYNISEFKYNEKRFEIMIGENYFSRNRIRLHIAEKEMNIHGELEFQNIIKLPKTVLRPGIMGPFSYIPCMECYHGIVNIHHDITGIINLSGIEVDFDKGYGYIEKDWGRSFPENWIWFQSNHFKGRAITIMFSVAKIPCFGSSFTGFLSILRYKEHTFVFATYTGAKLRKLDYNSRRVEAVIEDLRFRLEMNASTSDGGAIKAPKDGYMNRDITESISAIVNFRLSNRKGKALLEGTGTNAGLEIVNR